MLGNHNDNMSSVESASMSSSDVSEKGPIDFGVKAVSLKSQSDSSRLIQSGPLRSLPSPSITRQTSGFVPQHPPISVLGGVPQKSVNFNRVTSGSTPLSGMSTATTITAKPSHATSAVTSTTQSIHGSSTYLMPRGSGQMAPAPRASVVAGRTSVSTIQTLVRTQTSLAAQTASVNNVRAPSPSTTRTTVRVDSARPIVIPSTPTRPLALTPTTQLHITTSDKTLKVPVGSVAQVLPIRPTFCTVPAFVGQNQTATILQRTDGVTIQSGAAGTVLTTPVRLTPPLTPLISTQRVAVSVPARLTMQQHSSVVANVSSPRPQTPGSTNRSIGAPVPQNSPKIGGPVGSGTILTTSRLSYSTGPVSVSRVMPQGSMAPVSTKPGPGQPPISSGTRLPMLNHQSIAHSGKPRFSSVRPQNMVTSIPPSGLLVHSQIMVGGGNHLTTLRPTLVSNPASKQIIQPSIPGSIQLTPAIVTKSTTISVPPSVTSSTIPSPQLTPVIAKQAEMYKLAPAIPISRHGSIVPPAVSTAQVDMLQQQQQQQQPPPAPSPQVSTVYIPSTHRPNSNSGLIPPPTPISDRPPNATTITTYTLPSGASYFYEAPSGYKLAADAPLVARPLSPDAPLVSRQLSEGPLIARPYTPGLITSTQPMRFNPVMIVDPGVASNATSASGDQTTSSVTDTSAPAPAKLTSSPRPSILRKRDNDGNGNSKAVKNLSGVLSCSSSRSRTPSPPTPPASHQSRAGETPPTSLHLETGQSGAEIGPSSNGSTTISATSSPGPEDVVDPDRPTEMSPRKKPRKQLLNDANDPSDMEFISEDRTKKEKEAPSCDDVAEQERPEILVVKKHNNVSLLKTYKHSWKARSNHFQRYADVKSQKEKKMTVTELASQRHVIQRIRGWKMYHCGGQFEDLSEKESDIMRRFSIVKSTFEKENDDSGDKEALRITELIMGNIQRSKVFRDLMVESKAQMLKAMDHKVHVSEIISRCASKRNFKKREKY